MQRKQFRVLDHALLKAEELSAAGVGQNGSRLLKQMTQIVEMFLIRRSFLPGVTAPFSLELSGSHLLTVENSAASASGASHQMRMEERLVRLGTALERR